MNLLVTNRETPCMNTARGEEKMQIGEKDKGLASYIYLPDKIATEGWKQLSCAEKLSVNQSKLKEEFRVYDAKACERYAVVKQHYKDMRTYQTLNYVNRMYEKFHAFDKCKMTVWEAFDKLGDYVDSSDPDIFLPNIEHGFQTAEAIRKAGHPEWMQLIGLIHDMGKILFLWGNRSDGMEGTATGKQWALGGDTWIVGLPIPSSCVFPEFNSLNPDMIAAAEEGGDALSTTTGIYEKHCGLGNCKFAYGHDEYLYRFLIHNKSKFPPEALAIVRYHSCYPWHTMGEYHDLMNEQDHYFLGWVKEFNRFDLYTKDNERPNMVKLKPYYSSLVSKYLGDGELDW